MPFSSDSSDTTPTAIPEFLVRHATLRQLQIFEAVVRLGSFTRAAEELFLTQPTVSLQVKKLAETVNLRLLDQAGRSMRATEAGEQVSTACRGLRIGPKFPKIGHNLETMRTLRTVIGREPERTRRNNKVPTRPASWTTW